MHDWWKWLAGVGILGILSWLARGFWTLYGPSILERFRPHADRHVRVVLPPPRSDSTKQAARKNEPLADVAPSPVDELGLNPPDFRSYTQDILEGIEWQWTWKDGPIGEPRRDAIVSLLAYCPFCGMGVVPRPGDKLVPERGPSEAGGLIPGRVYPRTVHWVVYKCQDGHMERTVELPATEFEQRIRLRIEHNSRNPDTWRGAAGRIRAARLPEAS